MTRWPFAVALSIVVASGIAGEQPAAACPKGRVASRAPRPSTTRDLPAPSAPSAPSAAASSGAEAYNVERVNAYRRAAGLAPVSLDPALSSFARAGSSQLSRDHVPHGHFRSEGDSIWRQGFTGGSAENQGSPTGWPRAAADPAQNERRQIDQILAAMMGEGSGGGHFRNMMNPKAKRVGVGLLEDADGKLYLTNDFSE